MSSFKSALPLEVNELSKIYKKGKKNKDFVAVDRISFSMQAGEILGLLGPNGAGKTTTIQMLLSVLSPSSGQIKYFDKDLAQHRSEVLQQVAFASTYIDFPWRLTVRENLDVYSRLYKLSKKQRQERSHRFLKYFGIEDKQDNSFNKLSAGQRTRVMLSKAFLAYPKVVLLDEPTASLDPDMAVDVRRFVKQQRDEYGVSVLFTSHNMNEVSELCDRVMFLQNGKILTVDTPTNLVAQLKEVKISLNIGDGLKRTKQVSKKLNLDLEVDAKSPRLVTITLEEKQIAVFLNELAKQKVDYHRINIIKPNLEDYFLLMADKGKKKNSERNNVS